ncbi:MAG: hypothetical protein M5U19_09925 [Microthrixaceae bacterium]|nr:hypothetical protein [Microthrixaceae bacterium]
MLVTDGEHVIGFLHVKDLLAYEEMAPSDLLPPGLVRVALRWTPTRSCPMSS